MNSNWFVLPRILPLFVSLLFYIHVITDADWYKVFLIYYYVICFALSCLLLIFGTSPWTPGWCLSYFLKIPSENPPFPWNFWHDPLDSIPNWKLKFIQLKTIHELVLFNIIILFSKVLLGALKMHFLLFAEIISAYWRLPERLLVLGLP